MQTRIAQQINYPCKARYEIDPNQYHLTKKGVGRKIQIEAATPTSFDVSFTEQNFRMARISEKQHRAYT